MASKFDKPYRNVVLPDINKINSILSESAEIDTQKILQLSMINKIPLPIVIDNNGNNLIHIAINNLNKKSELNILNYIKFLIQQQVNPDQPNKENQTPLHIACQNQYLDIVNFLIEQQVNVNYQDNNGLTPLHYLLTGNIKVYDEKEITEFIVPNSEKKTSKVERKDLLKLKKDLWEILKQDKYQWVFKGIEKTIEDNIENNDEIKEKVLELKKNLANSLGDLKKKNSDYYLKYRQDIEEIILKKWNKFAPSDDIVLHDQEDESLLLDKSMGIIRNYDVKKRVKNNIKQSINDSLKIINTYQYTIQTNNLNDDLSKLLSDTLWNQVKSQQLNNKLDTLYKSNITNAFDFADNIIDIDNLLFFGGSRKVTIIKHAAGAPPILDHYNRLRDKLIPLSIQKKVIFILLIEYFKIYNFTILDDVRNNVFNIIVAFDLNNNIDGLFDPVPGVNNLSNVNPVFYGGGAMKYNAILNIAKQSYKEIFENQVSKKNLGQRIYSRYLNTILQHSPGATNLDHNLHKLFFKLIAALNNYPIDLEKSLDNVFKIDILPTINPQQVNGIPIQKNKLAIWTGFLLKKGIPLDAVTNQGFNANFDKIQLFDDTYFVGDDPLIDIMNGIRDINSNNQNIVAQVLEYYKNVNNTIPKLYIMDLIFYLLKPEKFIWDDINQLPFKNRFLDANHKWKKSGYEILQDEYCPSISKVIYISFEDVSTIPDGRLNALYTYLFSKFSESIELNLLFNGCIPELIEPINDFFSIIVKHERKEEKFNFNANGAPVPVPVNQQLPGNFIVQNLPYLPLPFNYFYNTVIPINYGNWGNVLALREKYFLYVEDRYRPPYLKSFNKLIINNFNSYNKILEYIMKDKFSNIFNTLLSKKQKISQIYSEFYLTSRLILNNQAEILDKITSEEDVSLFNFDTFTTKLNSINANIFMYYYLYKNASITRLPEFIYYKLNSNQYQLYNNLIRAPTQGNFGLVGGALNLSNLDFIYKYYFGIKEEINNFFPIIKYNKLPPSLEDNLDDFYQLNKIKFITDILK